VRKISAFALLIGCCLLGIGTKLMRLLIEAFFAGEGAVVMLPPFPNILDALLVFTGGVLCIYIYFKREGK